jgi:hypothetical protein
MMLLGTPTRSRPAFSAPTVAPFSSNWFLKIDLITAWSIRALGAEGDWIIVSGDPRISRGQAERAAWIESGLTAFFCGDAWGSRKLMTQAAEMLRWWDDIIDLGKRALPGSGYMLEFKTKEPTQIYPIPSRRPKRR